jgi:uncharacterized membrane protein
MKLLFLLPVGLLLPAAGSCCVSCNREIQDGIYNSGFYPNLLAMLSPFLVLALLVVVLAVLATKRQRLFIADRTGIRIYSSIPLSAASMVLGIGLGGFADGIVLHQLLQWHEMLSHQIPPKTVVAKSVNMFWDGIFHLYTLGVTVLGIVLLWRLLRRDDINHSGYLLAGGILIGWGLFNLVEGIINHHILQLHHVREVTTNPDAWNYGFLIFSLVLAVAGLLMAMKANTRAVK